MDNGESQVKFMTEFKNLLQEVGPSSDETESDSGFSLLDDEVVVQQDEKQHNRVSDDRKHDQSTAAPELSISPLEQLRKQALQHDCPHCQCCVGNLIEV